MAIITASPPKYASHLLVIRLAHPTKLCTIAGERGQWGQRGEAKQTVPPLQFLTAAKALTPSFRHPSQVCYV